MQMLYDSDSFVVVQMQADGPADPAAASVVSTLSGQHHPLLTRQGFEIVDKRSGKEVYLDGSWAELFQQQISAWQRKTPTQPEVEDALDRLTGLAQNPVVLH